MNRKDLFRSLSEPVQELLILLYHSEKEFIIAEPVALEDLLLSYDKVVGNDIYVKKIALSIFLRIPPRVDPDLYFLTTIETFLMSENTDDPLSRCRQSVEEFRPEVRRELQRLKEQPSPQNPELFIEKKSVSKVSKVK